MNPVTNPFAPGAGAPPPALVGRQAILDQAALALERVKLGRSATSLMIVGLRGVGKTVLLNRIGDISEHAGYVSEIIEIPEGRSLASILAPSLRNVILRLDRGEQINQSARRATRVLRGWLAAVKFTYSDVELSIEGETEPGVGDSGDIEADIPALLMAVGEAARARHTAVALIIDELQYLEEREMSALIMAMHKISQKQLPVILVGAGLPQLVGLTGRSKSYSERLFDFPQAAALAVQDSWQALQGPAEQDGAGFTDEALNEIYRVTEGYPYFLQEWGYQSWLAAAISPIDIEDVRRATPIALARLDRSFFRVRFDRLTPGEKRYLRAMAQLGPGPHRSGDISGQMRARVTSQGPVRASLIAKGMIFSPQHGDTAFTVPLFDQFLRRIMPGLLAAIAYGMAATAHAGTLAPNAPPTAIQGQAAAIALAADPLAVAIADPRRSVRFVARDGARHPLQELTFLGIRPDIVVIEIWPGGGYWTEILAPTLRERGQYVAAIQAAVGTDAQIAEASRDAASLRAKLAADPARYNAARLMEFGAGHLDIGPPGSADAVLTFRNLHNWMADGIADQVLAAFFRVLKPGGVLGIEEHRGRADRPQDPRAASGYVRQDYAIDLARRAGFVIEATSELGANPKDTADWPHGVWTLPPRLILGDQDRAKYLAIGEADNFVLRLRKPAS